MKKRLRRLLLSGAAILVVLVLAAVLGGSMVRTLTDIRKTEATHILHFYGKGLLLQLQGDLNEAGALAQTAKSMKTADASWFEDAAAPLAEREEIRYIGLFIGDTMAAVFPQDAFGTQIGHDLRDFSYMFTLAKVTKELVIEGPVTLEGSETDKKVFLFLQPFTDDGAYLGEVVVAMDRDYVLEQLEPETLADQGYDYELWQVDPENSGKEIVSASRDDADFSEAVKTTFNLPTEWNLSIQPANGWVSSGETAGILLLCGLSAIFLLSSVFLLLRLIARNRALRELSSLDGQTGMYNKMSFGPALDKWAADRNLPVSLFYLVFEDAGRISQLIDFQEEAAFLKTAYEKLENYIHQPFIAGRLGDGKFAVGVREEMPEQQMENFARGLSLELLLKTRINRKKQYFTPKYEYARWSPEESGGQEALTALIASYYNKRAAESPTQMLIDKCRQLVEGKSDVAFDEYTDPEMRELSNVFNQYRKKSEQLAYFDPVFRVGSRPKYFRDANMLISYDKKRQFILFCVDICAFSQYNQLFSADVGDSILREVIRRLSRLFGNYLYRINGDVFLGISLSEESEQSLAAKIQEILKEPVTAGKTSFTLQVRCAVCRYPANGSTPELLLDRTQSALRYAKELKRDVVSYNDSLDSMIRTESDILRRLKDAIRQETLEVWYQPIFHIESGRFTAAEALSRLPDGKGGYFSASEVIALAERSGLVEGLGDCVLAKACRFLRDFGKTLGIARVCVNLSVQQLLANSADHLLGIIRESGVDAARITLEITESLLIQSIERASVTLDKLRKTGIHIALDDFGVGYSSLNYLSNLPVNIIKTDRSLTQQILTNPKQKALLDAIVEMAKINALTVVSEGVESREEQEVVAASGVQYIQGYYYAKPMPEEELKRFLS